MANKVLPSGRRLCRLCLNDKELLYPIFSGGIADLDEKIYDCTAVLIEDIRNIPAYVCQLCRSKVFICHRFVLKCQKADRKYQKLSGPLSRLPKVLKKEPENRLSLDYPSASSSSEPMTPDAPRTGHTEKHPEKIPVKTMIDGTFQADNAVVHRLKNDDKLRRHSLDVVRKVPAVKVPIRRLSDEPTIEQLEAKIGQPLNSENELINNENGRRKCPICGHMVLNLQKHMVLHSTIRKYVCEICDKRFTESYYLRYHLNTHTGEKPYKCPQCGQCFGNPAMLSNHKRAHHRDNPNDGRFHCNVCHSAFKHRKLMNKHMRTHHRERKHSCGDCGKAYYTKTYLKKHRQIIHSVVE